MDNSLEKIPLNQDVATFQYQIDTAEKIAEIVVKSPIYSKLFEIVVPDTINNLDENGKPTKTIITINKEDIVACILLGRELGLSDMAAITMGKALDKMAYFKVMKGRELGLDAISSLQHVFAYENDGKIIIGTDGQATNAVVIKAGIKFEFIKDFERKSYYRTFIQGKIGTFLGFNLNEDWVVFRNNMPPDELKESLSKGKTLVTEHYTFCSEVKFTREGWQPLVETYSLLEATEAGLYQGYDFNGNLVKGKPAWNGNPKRILNTRIISIGENRIGGDVLNGTYTKEEIDEIINKSKDDEITSSEIVS
jgi:hypothetical protein